MYNIMEGQTYIHIFHHLFTDENKFTYINCCIPLTNPNKANKCIISIQGLLISRMFQHFNVI